MAKSCLIKILFLTLLLLFAKFIGAQHSFMQKVNHKIDVVLDVETKTLRGNIETEYKNNSADTLDFIYYHFWPNAYESNSTEFALQQLSFGNPSFHYASDEYRGYLECSDTKVDGVDVVFNDFKENVSDIKILYLPQPLPPGGSFILTSDIFVKIPVLTSRMGWKNNDFCLTQWYPKPVVYDSEGWHPMSYLDMGEFYSEFGDFEVSITLPDNFLVAATGDLITRNELHRLEDFAEICSSAKNIDKIGSFGDSSKQKTITYIAKNVHDFAWFASSDFIVDRKTHQIKNRDKHVACWTFYHKSESWLWQDAVKYISKTIDFMTDNVGDYPFNNCVAVDAPIGAGGGMEYPGITVVKGSNKATLERVIAHEVIHNWFYGMLASNERSNPWIDEGFTSFYECKYFDFYYKEKGLLSEFIGSTLRLHGLENLPARYSRELAWKYLISENIQQDPKLTSEEFSALNYFILSYYKPVIAIYSLEEFLGADEFKNLMRSFFDKYKNTHIVPQDFITHFAENTDKNISWFFDDFILSNKLPDYRICRIKNDSVIIKNAGETLSPLFLQIEDSMIIVDGFTGKRKFFIGDDKTISIDPNFKTLDVNRSNNYYRKGIFHPNRPVKLSFANFLENPQINHIPIFPILSYNTVDGFSPGILLYSTPFPKRKFEYQLMPLFGVKSELLTGMGNLSYYLHPKTKVVREIEFAVSGRRFGLDRQTKDYYFRVSPAIKISLKTSAHNNAISQILLRSITASKFYEDGVANMQQIRYEYRDYAPVNPWSIVLDFHSGKGFKKLSAEYVQKINYNERIGLNLRFFAGKFLYSASEYYGNYNYRLAGNTGDQDYFYDNLYVGRTEDIRQNPENLWAHQFVRNDGGFTMYSPLGQTDNWLFAVNIDSETPLGIIDLYLNLGAFPNPIEDSPDFLYEAGIKLNIFKDFMCVYFPVAGSEAIWDVSNAFYTDNYVQKVRFTLSLEKLNLLNYRNKPFLLF